MVSVAEIGASQPPAPSASNTSASFASLRYAPTMRSCRIETPSNRAAKCGDAGVRSSHGFTSSYEALTLLAANKSSASSLNSPSGVFMVPAATGFMTATRRPRATSARVSATVASVLPTPVSVPVTKYPFMDSISRTRSATDRARRNQCFARAHAFLITALTPPGAGVDDFPGRGNLPVLAPSFVGARHRRKAAATREAARAPLGDVVRADGLELAHQ